MLQYGQGSSHGLTNLILIRTLWQPEFDRWDLHGGRSEPILQVVLGPPQECCGIHSKL